MDAGRFDAWTRAWRTRRAALGGVSATLAALAAGFGPLPSATAKRRKKKGKNKGKKGKKGEPRCTPDCAGKECGPDGCNKSCGACSGGKSCNDGQCLCPPAEDECGAICCGDCQVCDQKSSLCIAEPGSDDTACDAGACCGGACCPPSCQCGVPGVGGIVAELLADSFGLPYPFCNAIGTGQPCNPSAPACQPGTTCLTSPSVPGIGVCGGLCAGVVYPAF